MKGPQAQLGNGGGWFVQRMYGPVTVLAFLMLGVSLLFLEDIRISVRKVLIGAVSQPTVRATISGTVLPASAVRCNRLTLPASFYNESQGPYNPAAVRHPITGEWLLVYTYDEVWFGISEYARTGNYLEGRMRSHPLLIKLGTGATPAVRKLDDVQMLELDDGFGRVQKEFEADLYKAADWRPFIWRDEVYLGHWIGFLPAQERMAIARLDADAGIVRYVYRFSHLSDDIETAQHPDIAIDKQSGASLRVGPFTKKEKSGFKREKNWGFVEEDGALMIYYALLPCTVVLEFDMGQPDGVLFRSRTCYDEQAAIIKQQTGLDILDFEMHSSGNPVPWDVENGAEHKEYLSMLHVKKGDYAHWAIRINRETRRITHVSAGPVVKARDYRNEGFLQTALVVSSFHVLEQEAADGVVERSVRILYGEGDRYGCWLDVAADAIVWHELTGEGALPPEQSGGGAAKQIPQHQAQEGTPSQAADALERAKSHLRASLVPGSPAGAPSAAESVSPAQAAHIKDTSMGRLEHRLEAVGQQVISGAVTSYDAWVHGDTPSSPPAQQHSVATQLRTKRSA